MTAEYAPTYDEASHAPRRRVSGAAGGIRRETAARTILTLMYYIALWRASGMWYGLPANFEDGAEVDPLPMKLLLYSLIPLSGVYAIIEPTRFIQAFSRVSPLIVIVGLSCVVSIIVSIEMGASIKGLAACAVLATPPLLYRARYGNVQAFRVLGHFAIAAAFINVLYTAAFPQFAIMRGNYAGMVKGAFYHKNVLGQFCAISFICLLPTETKLSKAVSYGAAIKWTAMLLLLGLIVATKSSTAVVLTAFGSVLLFALRGIHVLPGRGVRSAVVVTLLIILCVAVAFAYLGVAEAIAEAFGKDLTFSGRTNIWDQLMPLIWDRPFFGYGFAVFRQPDVMAEYVRVTFDAHSTHNTYLELALNIGIPGVTAWVLFLLGRLFRKLTAPGSDAISAGVRRKEIVIVILIMLGSLTEAGMMLAPFILWPHTVVALSEYLPRRKLAPARRRIRSQHHG